MLSQLIKSLNIFLKYRDVKNPTHCEHDVMHVNIDPSEVSEEDKIELNKLGFIESDECFISFKYGSS